MCDPVSAVTGIAAAIGAATSIGTTAYSNKKQKEAEARQRQAEKEARIKSLQQKESVAKTAQTPTVNTDTKKTLASLKIPSTKSSGNVINTGGMSTGLNIPM